MNTNNNGNSILNININNPNLVKQPKQCCVYCGKSYKVRANLNKHIIFCEIVDKTKRKKNILIENEEDNELPSQRQMYNMLVELTLKYNKLEQKVEKMNRFVDKKIKKINMIDWLNSNKCPDYTFDKLINKMNVNQEDTNVIFDKNVIDIISILLSRELFENEIMNNAPIYAAIQKNNYIYIYQNNNHNQSNILNQNNIQNQIINQNDLKGFWCELSREILISFMNKFQNKMIKVLSDWKKNNQNNMNSSDKLCEQYNKSLMKIMAIDFKNEQTYNKIKSLFYNKLKTDMKAIIEYEFEF